MKNIYSSHIRKINGQDLFFLNFEEWDLFLGTKEFNNIQVKNVFHKIVKRDTDLMHSYEELQLTLGFVRENVCMPYMLIRIKSVWHRISIEYRNCFHCQWDGLVGLTAVSDIYVGISPDINKFELIKNAGTIEKKGCPNCGSHFKDHIIWTEKGNTI